MVENAAISYVLFWGKYPLIGQCVSKIRLSARGPRITHPAAYLFTTHPRVLTTVRKKPFENTVGKGENA